MLHEVEVAFKLHPDVRSLHEEWSGIGNPKARRKLQNRLNQRALRRRKLAEKQFNQESSVTDRDPEYAVATPSSSPTEFSSTPLSFEYGKHRQMIRAGDALFANFGQVVQEYVERDMTYRLPADHLLSLIYYNVFRAFSLNIQRLGLSIEGMCLDEYQSKFPDMPPNDPSLALLPPGLQPTQLQRSIPHHPMWDIFPDPVLRDNILRYGENNFDDVALCSQIFGDGDTACDEDTCSRTGLIVWGPDPSLTYAWEVTEKFARNWSWFLKGAIDLQNATNMWRRMRGESPIVFEVP